MTLVSVPELTSIVLIGLGLVSLATRNRLKS